VKDLISNLFKRKNQQKKMVNHLQNFPKMHQKQLMLQALVISKKRLPKLSKIRKKPQLIKIEKQMTHGLLLVKFLLPLKSLEMEIIGLLLCQNISKMVVLETIIGAILKKMA